MADTDVSREDRQLPASQKRLRKAAEDGRVARSRDVGHALLIGTALLTMGVFGPTLAGDTLQMMRGALQFSATQVLDPAHMPLRLRTFGEYALWAVLPTLAAFVAAAIAASMIPGGLVFSGKPVSFDFSRISPASGLGRVFSRHSAIDALKLLAVSTALATGAWMYSGGSLERFGGLAGRPLAHALAGSFDTLGTGLTILVGILFAVALVDAPLQWFRLRSDLKMTHQEVREEAKETEGDPHLRARIRSRQREISRSRMLSAVPSADVVITNPTHYAVAIRYDENRMGAPRVVAKGADLIAGRIREIAAECGVPLMEAPPLARALYANVDVDHEIPAALYSAVAQELAYVFQLRHHVPGRGQAPRPPGDLDVPAELDPRTGEA